MSRPPESVSMVVSILAITTGFRWPRMNTEVAEARPLVHTAAAASTATGSRYGVSGCGKRPPR